MSDDEAQALERVLREAIDGDRFPLSGRAILARLKPGPVRAPPLPPQRHYEPPSGGRYKRS